MKRLETAALLVACLTLTACTMGMKTVPDTWRPDQGWSLQQGRPDCEASSGRGVASFVVGGAIALPSSYLGLLLLAVRAESSRQDDDLDTALAISGAAAAIGIATIAAGGYGLRNASRCRKATRAFDCALVHAELARSSEPLRRRLIATTPSWCFEPPYGTPLPALAPPNAPAIMPPLSPPGSTPPTPQPATDEPIDAEPIDEPLPGAGPPES